MRAFAVLAALAIAALAPAQAVTRADVAAALARHAGSLGDAEALQHANLLWTGTLERRGEVLSLRVLVRRAPFAVRRELARAGAATPAEVTVTDGRYAWRPLEDGRGEPLPAEAARACLELAFLDGFLYLDPRWIAALPERATWDLRDHAGLPGDFETGLRTNPVSLRSPAGTILDCYVDARDGRLHEIASQYLRPVRWTRFGSFRAFGPVRLPSLRVSGTLEGEEREVVRIESLEIGGALDDALFAGNPRPLLPRVLDAGPLLVCPHTLPGSAHLLLPEVEVGGSAAALALLDTGAERTCVLPELAGDLDLPPRGPFVSPAITTMVRSDTVWIDALDIGAFRAPQVLVAATPIPGIAQLHADAQPGLFVSADVLMEHAPVLDLAAGKLLLRGAPVTALAELTSPGSERVVTVPMRRAPGRDNVQVTIEIGGKPVTATVDTGMAPVLWLSRAGLERAGLPLDEASWRARGATRTSITEASGARSRHMTVSIPEFRLGRITYRDPVVQIALDEDRSGGTDDRRDALLGGGALLPFARIGFDVERGQLELEPRAGAVRALGDGLEVPPAGVHLGLVLASPAAAAHHGMLGLPVISAVGEGSLAARRGLAAGDRVRALAGESCAGRAAHEIQRRLWLQPGEHVRLEVIGKSGARRTVELP
jgi:hypothetical protein